MKTLFFLFCFISCNIVYSQTDCTPKKLAGHEEVYVIRGSEDKESGNNVVIYVDNISKGNLRFILHTKGTHGEDVSQYMSTRIDRESGYYYSVKYNGVGDITIKNDDSSGDVKFCYKLVGLYWIK